MLFIIKPFSPFDNRYDYLRRYILTVSSGIDEPGEIRLPLAASLLVAWIAVYFCLYKGIKSSGKVSFQGAFFKDSRVSFKSIEYVVYKRR